MKYLPLTRIDLLVVHASGATDGDIGAAELRRRHRSRGWRHIGYHFVVRRDGSLEEGRPTNMPGGHENRVNRRSLGVCLIGGGNDATPAQLTTLATLATDLKTWLPELEVVGHRDVPGVRTSCPGFSVRDWWDGLSH